MEVLKFLINWLNIILCLEGENGLEYQERAYAGSVLFFWFRY
jgi:hypothetical protein